jgi:hypothetical protein
MHPATSSPLDENAQASAHLLKLFIQDPVIQSLLPKDPPASHPAAEELSALQLCLASIENALANLARAQALPNAEAPAAEVPSAWNWKIPSIGPSAAWPSALQLIDVPTGKSATCEAYTSEEIHDALKDENPHYAKLKIIRSPSWEQKNLVTS